MRRDRAFSLLELLVIIVIIGILITIALPVIAKIRARAQRAQCTANLKNLHVGAQLYMQEHNHWPQIRLSAQTDSGLEDFAEEWIAALTPFSVPAKAWICPTHQNEQGNPDYSQSGNERVDYIGTWFDDKPTTPYDLGTPGKAGQTVPMPWFSENGDRHGNGNLLIFADGSVKDVTTILANVSPAPK